MIPEQDQPYLAEFSGFLCDGIRDKYEIFWFAAAPYNTRPVDIKITSPQKQNCSHTTVHDEVFFPSKMVCT